MQLWFTRLLLSSLFVYSTAHGEVGVTDINVKLGCVGAKTGGAGEYGVQMATAIHAYFDKLNKAGGVNGRQIEFLDRDDGYDPAKSAELGQALVQNDKIFAFLAGLGSSQQKALLPLVAKDRVPMLFPISGNNFLRQPVDPNIFNLRISYQQELELLIDHAVTKLKLKNIGMLYQDDALGQEGLAAMAPALAKHGLTLKRSASYVRNTTDVAKAVEALSKAGVDAVYIQGTVPPALAFVKEATAAGFKPTYLGPSILGNERFAGALKGQDVKVFATATVPLTTDSSFAIVQQYNKDMAAAGIKNLTTFSLESYISANVFVEGLKRAGKNLTREGLKKAFEEMRDVNIGGLKVSFSPTNHQGFTRGFIVKLQDGALAAAE